MIEATRKGLPVDMSKLPPSLSAPPERHVLKRQNTLPHVRNVRPLQMDRAHVYIKRACLLEQPTILT